MFQDIKIAQSCSVSEEFINMVAHQFPRKLIRNGKVDPMATLNMLGFRTNGLYDVSYEKDVYIRNNQFPSQVYKGSFYNGKLRNNLSKQGEEGYALYNTMFNLFSKYEVLQPNDLTGKEFECIMTIGCEREYSK